MWGDSIEAEDYLIGKEKQDIQLGWTVWCIQAAMGDQGKEWQILKS